LSIESFSSQVERKFIILAQRNLLAKNIKPMSAFGTNTDISSTRSGAAFQGRSGYSMRRGISITLFVATLFMIFPATTFAGECSDEVKRALTNATWMMAMDHKRGRRSEFPLQTRVAADGTLEVVGNRDEIMKITCDGKQIVFDWKNEERKRFTLTLGTDGVFRGSRTSSDGEGHPSTLKKN
jgi:hypothetical protein